MDLASPALLASGALVFLAIGVVIGIHLKMVTDERRLKLPPRNVITLRAEVLEPEEDFVSTVVIHPAGAGLPYDQEWERIR